MKIERMTDWDMGKMIIAILQEICSLDYVGRKHGYAIDGNRLVVVGHIDAYDELVAALKKLDKSEE